MPIDAELAPGWWQSYKIVADQALEKFVVTRGRAMSRAIMVDNDTHNQARCLLAVDGL